MQRSITVGLLGTTFVGGAALLAIALSTVLNFGGDDRAMVNDARESMRAAIDAPRPEDVAAAAPAAKPVQPPLATPLWIWAPGDAVADAAVLIRRFTLPAAVKAARLVASVDNAGRVLLDGREIGSGDDWASPFLVEIGELAEGRHELVVEARNEGGPAGAVAMLEWTGADGLRARLVTDGSWRVGDAGARILGPLGSAPWGEAMATAFGPTTTGDIDRAISVPEGFVCELVYAVPKSKGSVVSLAADAANGRLVAGPQYGNLFAIRPCADGADASETAIEPIEPAIGRAHGFLVVENDLFAVVNEGGGDARGVWRLRDTDGDGRYDEKKPLASVARDGGEHGPHQVVLAPDGSLWIVGGNHCAPPEEALADSRVPALWREDIAFDRLWDANGHAVGVMAPGGWIARTDREGAKWELVSIGYRNSYDVAFDALGRAYTFDSDMEWDMGLPWYRPTRVCEVASGVDFGWRSGSGKWASWSPDSLPAAVDVGPASPTGVLSAEGLDFPAPWNEALFFLDWTYGTMWAGWPTDATKDASSPELRIEPFLAGRPLPLTDAVALDGAMYFAVGGRNLPSAVYRVRAANPVAAPRAAPKEPAALAERRALERYHRRMEWAAEVAAVEAAFPALSSEDAGVRSAARIALEHQSPEKWREKALAEGDPQAAVLALTALARAGDPATDAAPVAARLAALEPSVRGTANEKPWLRACELWLVRLAPEDATTCDAAPALRDALLAAFPAPATDRDALERDKHRVNLLAKLGAPQAVAGAIAILERPEGSSQAPVDAALLARGGPYGKAVADMLANAPSTGKIGIAYAVRTAKTGWTPDYRERFARAIAGLRRAKGGNSFNGFLKRIDEEFRANAPESERELLARVSSGGQGDLTLPVPRGPGRAWTVEAIAALGPKLVSGREYAEGLRAYQAAQCAQCHRAGGIGGGGGPDLSGVSRRFSLEDLAVAMVEPSRTVSDQYANTDYLLKDGRTVTGRAASEDDASIEVRTSLLSDATERLAKADIVSTATSVASPMPAHLVDTLSEGELLDLLAFLRAGGDAGDPAFARVADNRALELFDGKSLAAFDFDPAFWSIEAGEIVGRTTEAAPAPHNTFLVWHGEARDFELEVELKVAGNNSGVQYRSEVFGPRRMRGPQIDAHPAPQYLAMCYEEQARGILAERGTRLEIAADGTRTPTPLEGATREPVDPAEWHTYRVVAKGDVVEHFLDGVPTATVLDRSADRAKGTRIGVQIHAGEPTEVRVRSIRLRRLD